MTRSQFGKDRNVSDPKSSLKRLRTDKDVTKYLVKEVEVENEVEEDLPVPTLTKNISQSKKQIVETSSVTSALRTHWDWIFENIMVKKRRKIILKEDNHCIDYEVKDNRKLITPAEYYLDVNKLEKLYYEDPDSIPPALKIVITNNFRGFLSERVSIKRGLVHIASLAKIME